MKIAVDAMGGDHAPGAVVEGAVQAIREQPGEFDLVLVGDETKIKNELTRLDSVSISNLSIVHASEVVKMHELPVLAVRKKKDSSITRAASLLKDREVGAIVTAGNTGAAVVATKVKCRSLPGVERPAIAAVMPAPHGAFLLLDVGATVDCKSRHLSQFAVMGNIFARYIMDIENPKVGILSLGEEETKGTELTRDTYKLLQKAKLNFIGNVEGSDLFTNKVDVIVCDGFMGNVALKVCESLAGAFEHIIKEEIMKDTIAKLGALLIKRTLKRIAKKVHYAEYGGAPLLGINGNCIISHGRSNPYAIKNAIFAAKRLLHKELNRHIIEAIADL